MNPARLTFGVALRYLFCDAEAARIIAALVH
jgi:hypothetical protein